MACKPCGSITCMWYRQHIGRSRAAAAHAKQHALQEEVPGEGGSQTVMLAMAEDEEMGGSMQPAPADAAGEDEAVHLEA